MNKIVYYTDSCSDLTKEEAKCLGINVLPVYYYFDNENIEYGDEINLTMREFFKKIENKTNVDKDTIMSLAEKLQGDNMKNEDNIRDVIRELSKMTGKEVSKEQEDKIINTIVTDNVPKNVDKMF